MESLVPINSAVIADAVNSGVLNAVEVSHFFIDRVTQTNPQLNAIVEFKAELALGDAVRVAARIAGGERLPLAGVPVVVKDCIWVKSQPTNQGCRALADFVAAKDSLVVERVRNAGGIILGRGNMSELGCKDITDNQLYGPTLHPLNPSLTPGGSSGGCAVAVATGMAPIALGTDAGGSSRRPPAHVGVVGYKPTNGVVADPFGFPSIAPGIDTLCPIGTTVEDVRRLFEVIVGSDPRDPSSFDLPERSLREPGRLRIAYSPLLGLKEAIDDDVAGAVGAAIDHLVKRGLNIVKADPIWPTERQDVLIAPIELAGLASLYGETWQRDPSLFDPHVGKQIAAGLKLSGIDVVRARAASLAIWCAMQSFFEDFDLLIGPTLACVSWGVDHIYPEMIGGRPAGPRGHAVFTPLFNHARTPAITVPCGSGRNGLPVGLQVIGRQFADRQLLAAAQWIETALGAAARPWGNCLPLRVSREET